MWKEKSFKLSFGFPQVSCCKKEEFRCFSGECIKAERTCDGVTDCGDSSDEMEAQCSTVRGGGATPLNSHPPEGDSDKTVILGVFGGLAFVVVLGCAILMMYKIYERRKPTMLTGVAKTRHDGMTPAPSMADTVQVGRLHQQNLHLDSQDLCQLPGLSPLVAATSANNMAVSSTGAVQPTTTGDEEPEMGSSNGVMYDRSHVTGASSSASSSGFQHRAPQPSPTTTVRNAAVTAGGSVGVYPTREVVSTMPHHHSQLQHRYRMGGRHLQAGPRSHHHQHHHGSHLSMQSLSRHNRQLQQQQQQQRQQHHHHPPSYSLNQAPPPPTPCSTDLNDESDQYMCSSSAAMGAAAAAAPPARRHFTSAANSTYEDSDVGGGGGGGIYQESSPLYQQHQQHQQHPSASADERSPFVFINSGSVLPEPPPPSRAQSPPLVNADDS